MNRRHILFLVPIILALIGFLAFLNREWLLAQLYLRTLESEARVSRLEVSRVIESLEIEPGDRIADIGAGTGLFTRALARATGKAGTVYAVDVNRDLLAHIESSAREHSLGNIQTVLGAAGDARIPEKVDLVLLCDTLHHIADRAAYLGHLGAYLAPGGRIAIIDFSENWPFGHGNMIFTQTNLDSWMRAAGYTRVASHAFIPDNFFVIYGMP